MGHLKITPYFLCYKFLFVSSLVLMCAGKQTPLAQKHIVSTNPFSNCPWVGSRACFFVSKWLRFSSQEWDISILMKAFQRASFFVNNPLWYRKGLSVSEKVVVTPSWGWELLHYSMFLREILFSVNFTAGFFVCYLYLINGKGDFNFLSPNSFFLSHVL